MLANEVLAHGHKRKGLPRSCPTSMELALPECLPGLFFDFDAKLYRQALNCILYCFPPFLVLVLYFNGKGVYDSNYCMLYVLIFGKPPCLGIKGKVINKHPR